jgi:hypothetical protein
LCEFKQSERKAVKPVFDYFLFLGESRQISALIAETLGISRNIKKIQIKKDSHRYFSTPVSDFCVFSNFNRTERKEINKIFKVSMYNL